LGENSSGSPGDGKTTASDQSQSGDDSAPQTESQTNDSSGTTTSGSTPDTSGSQSPNSNQSSSTQGQQQQTDGKDGQQQQQDDDPGQTTGSTDGGVGTDRPSSNSTEDQSTSGTDGGTPDPIPVTWPTGPGGSTDNPPDGSTGPPGDDGQGPGGQQQPPPGTPPQTPPANPPGGPDLPGLPGFPPNLAGLPNPGDPDYMLAGSCMGLNEGWADGYNDGLGGAPDSRRNEACTASQHAPTEDPAVSKWNVDYSNGIEDGYPLGYAYGSALSRVVAAAEAQTEPNPADVAAMKSSALKYLALLQSGGCAPYMAGASPSGPSPPPSSSSSSSSSPPSCSPSASSGDGDSSS